MVANVCLYPTELCQYSFKSNQFNEKKMVCAGDSTKGNNTEKLQMVCQGDSGG